MKKIIMCLALLIGVILGGCAQAKEGASPTKQASKRIKMMKDNTIRVGSFNLASMRNPDSDAQNKLVVAHKIDVLGVQEVDIYTKRMNTDMLKDLSKQDYGEYKFAKAMDWKGQGEFGIGILSKYAIGNYRDGLYDVTGEEDRAYQNIKIKTADDEKLSIYNTHLAFESIEIRKKQVNQLLEIIKKDDAKYFVILGDFNMDQSHDEWDIFTSNGFNIANGKDNKWFETFTWRDDTMKTYDVDNIIVSPNIEIKKVKMTDTPVSDHNMLYADLVLK